MKNVVSFRPMNDIVKIVKLKPVVVFEAGKIYTGIKKPKNMVLGYTDLHHEPVLIKSSFVIFEERKARY